MNIYDTKPIYCSKCGRAIGEASYDAEIIFPKCGSCANPMPHDDKMLTINDLPADEIITVLT